MPWPRTGEGRWRISSVGEMILFEAGLEIAVESLSLLLEFLSYLYVGFA